MRLRTLRTALLTTVALGIAAFIGYAILRDNPERAALEAQISRVDVALVQRLAMARDVARYSAEREAMRDKLDALELRLTPDLAAIRATVARSGARVELVETATLARYRQITVHMRAPDRVALAALVSDLERSPYRLRLRGAQLDAAGAAELRAVTCARLPQRAEAEAEAPPSPPKPPWYTAINAELRERLHQKQQKLAELDRKLGAAVDFPRLKHAYDAGASIEEAFEADQPDLRDLAQALFLGAQPILTRGRMEAKPELVVVEGAPAAPLDRAAVAAALGPDLEIVRFRPGPPLELSLRPRAP